MRSSPELRAIFALEPRVYTILVEAKHTKPIKGYNRILTYYDFRDELIRLVGWEARNPVLRTMAAYDLAVGTMSDLLPWDPADLNAD